MIVDASEKTRGNHPGIEFKGKWYCFGHSYDLLKQITDKFYERRSVDMDDGLMRMGLFRIVRIGRLRVLFVSTFNPFNRVEAETMAWVGCELILRLSDGDFDWDRGTKIDDHLFQTPIITVIISEGC